MRDFIKRHKVGMALLGAVLIGGGTTASVFAAIPYTQGLINGCFSDQSGQLKVIDSTASCSTGESAVSWDRGVLAYGFLTVDESDPQNITPVLEQTRGVAAVTLSPTVELGYCIEIAGTLEDSMRFPHAQVTSAGSARPAAYLANTTAVASVVEDACTNTTDLFIDMSANTSGVYFSIF